MEVRMNSTVESLDLSEIVFSRARSRFMVFEEANGGHRELFLSLTYDAPGKLRSGLINLKPWHEGREIPYTYIATPDSLEIWTAEGTVRLAIDEPDILRIRAEGVGLRLFAPMKTHEGAVDRLNGQYEISFAAVGKLLFVPITGSLDFNAGWILDKMRPEDVQILCTPGDGGVFEAAVHEYIANEPGRDSYRPFDECVKEAREDYEDWWRKYGEFSELNRPTARLAAYTIWICRQIPHRGNPHSVLKNEVIYANRNGYCMAFSMDQFLQSMAITNDMETSYYYLTNIFPYMLENGQLPNWVNDVYTLYNASRAPMAGAVTEIFIKNYGMEAISNERWKQVYHDLVYCASWWMNYRVSGEIKFHYHYREECGFHGSTMFSGGCPVCTADLMTFMAVLSDVIGRIANYLNIDESEVWWEYSENVIDSMLCDLWHATGYVSRAAGGMVESGSLLNFVPLILGGRLPQDAQQCLIDALKWDPLRSSKEGLLFEKGRDRISLNAEQMVILGMLANGDGEDILENVVESLRREGIYDTLPRGKHAPGAAWSSAAAASALILLRAYEDLQKKESEG